MKCSIAVAGDSVVRCVRAAAGKGFGSAKAPPPPAKTSKKNSPAVPSTRPVSEEEARRGRLDVVTVKDWGSGKQEDLGALQVMRHAVPYRGDDTRPLHVQLARQLEFAQKQGSMQIASYGDSSPMPPFERWSFSLERYCQYLTDLLCVHEALEQAIDRVAALAAAQDQDVTMVSGAHQRSIDNGVGQQESSSGSDGGDGNTFSIEHKSLPSTSTGGALVANGRQSMLETTSQPRSVQADSRVASALCTAFGQQTGLGRAAAIAHDLAQLRKSHKEALGEAETSTRISDMPSASLQSTGASKQGKDRELRPSHHTMAYAQHLTSLSLDATTQDPTCSRSPPLLRLFAHAYVIRISLLALGARVGSVAAEKLHLPARQADELYRSYPEQVADPMRSFAEALDAAGKLLKVTEIQVAMDELPSAGRKTSLLLTALAHES